MKTAAWNSVLWLCLWFCLMEPSAAQALATATIVDGEAHLVRGALKYTLAEGVRLDRDDIVETTGKTRFVRLEFADGVMLDLGPGTRALLGPRFSGPRARQASRAHLLGGVAKITAPQPITPGAPAITLADADVTGVARSAVVLAQGAQLQVFAESGPVTVQERRGGRPAGSTTVKSSEFYHRAPDGKGSTSARPTGAFIQALPRPFMDSLPSRAAAFAGREVAPKPIGEIGYAEAAPWLVADGLRPHFVNRWRALARVPAFREPVAANMAHHPEWDRVLHPEKYLPKPGAATASAPVPYGRKP